jgi:gluconate 2-dehydrogenase gamma chain
MSETVGSEDFDTAEAEVLDAVVERLIPTDECGPGAREARVSRYIVRALASQYQGERDGYRAGLSAIDAYANAKFGTPFTALSENDQTCVLRHVEEHDATHPTAGGFFALIRRHAIEGMFGDPSWGGNANRVGWELIGYPGPKPVWTFAEQEIETSEREATHAATPTLKGCTQP